MNNLAQFGMFKAGVRVSDVTIYHYYHPSTTCVYSASEIDTRLLRQLKIDAGLVSQKWRPALRGNLRRLCIDDIYINDIYCQCKINSRDPWVIYF